MEEFSDGQDIIDDSEQIISDSDLFESEPEQNPVPVAPSIDVVPSEQKNTDSVEQMPDESVNIEETAEQLSYDDLIKALTEQTAEIKAIHELEDKKQEFYTTYQNMALSLIVGVGLLFGGLCAVILANYLRHG